MTDIPELTEEQLKKAIPARLRKRLMQGRFESGEDIVALRRFVGLTQAEFALLRIAARHPRIIRENLRSAA
jgi:DNA-binding transcriptional regulator YiaG